MDDKQKSQDDDWLFYGPVIAFSIIGVVAGGLIGSNKGESILSVILGVLLGGVLGFILGAMIGGFLDSLFDDEVETSKQNYQSFNSSNNNQDNNSKGWEKFADELLKIIADANNPYTILESKQEDDFDTIKSNFRRLVRQYHPDHLGANASEAMHKYAKEMSQKINEAYEIIKKQRGIK